MGLGYSSLNRTQQLVLGFFAFAWAALIMILAVAPGIYERTLRLPGGERELPALYFLAAISVFIALLRVGVVRRWRWTFWLVLVVFLLGVMRLPAYALQLVGVVPAQGPACYALLQAFLGVVRFAIGLVMVASYRWEGVWGSF